MLGSPPSLSPLNAAAPEAGGEGLAERSCSPPSALFSRSPTLTECGSHTLRSM